ncbi:hypothetical protein MNBD_GAMMA12-891 [hydrothermal vent metagenome]|uniref:PpiC domain-containing protein n=1 Tax=hydrothermal vent metagenome TaxID=652676 RepID=A0A3B0YLS4_9ZZZZ
MHNTFTNSATPKKHSSAVFLDLGRYFSSLCIIVSIIFISACENKSKSNAEANIYKKLFKKKGTHQHAKLPYKTLAIINLEVVSEPLFELFLSAKKQANPAITIDRAVATKNLVNIFLLAQKARQENIHKIRKVKEQLKFQKISLLAKLYLNKMKASIVITDQEMELAHRKRYLDRDNHEYKTRHIVLKNRKMAITIMRKLVNNENFATLARRYSTAPSSSFGGALEWFRPDAVSRKFAAAVRRLSKGETSRYPLKTNHGYHIILLEDVRKVSPPSLKNVYLRLREDLVQNKIKKHIEKLRRYSTITINQKN